MKKGLLYMQAFSRTTGGVSIADGPVIVDDGTDSIALGEQVLKVLSLSTTNVKQPKSQQDWLEVQRPMLQAVGARTWTTMAKGAKCIGLEVRGDVIYIEPSQNYGNKGGTSQPEKALLVPSSPALIGQAVIAALEVSS